MFKKTVMIMSLVCVGFTQVAESRNDKDNTGSVLATVAATGVAIGTGVYLAGRESNDVKMRRVRALQEEYDGPVRALLAEIELLHDVYLFAQQSVNFKRDLRGFDESVERSFSEISNRYDSYLKPWNWTAHMKHAYDDIYRLRQVWSRDKKRAEDKICDMAQRMHAVNIISRYTSLMDDWNAHFDDAGLLKFVRGMCRGCSSYPMHACAQMLQDDLAVLYATRCTVACDSVLIQKMEQLEKLVVSSQAYVDESRIRDEIELRERIAREEQALQERIARAEEAKAAAQQSQAWAQQQQAWAQEEQARAQKQQAKALEDSNRIEREKNHKNN